jgi:Plasmid pRiA4b ORF-3-like protein
MAGTDRHGPHIYQLRAVLRGISPLVWRRLLVRSDSTVAQLHEVLQVAFGWDDEHLNRFEIRGREYAVYRDGGGMIGIDARGVRLDGLKLRRLERSVYEYDFGDSWIHDLRFEASLPVAPRKTYPVCVAGECSAPPEDCGGPHAFMSNRQLYARCDRERSDEDLDEIMDDFDEEESDSFTDYDPDRFDRRQINRAPARLATG